MITILHILAFFEFPSSLSWSSDIQSRGDRIHFPCGVTEAIEIICLILLIADAYIKVMLNLRQEIRLSACILSYSNPKQKHCWIVRLDFVIVCLNI